MSIVLPCHVLEKITTDIFEYAGMDRPDAQKVSRLLLDADIRGVGSHGVTRIKQYVDKIRSGGSDPHASMEILRETPVSAVVDAKGGMGALAGDLAVQLAREKAAKCGIALVHVIHSNHFGMAGHWSLRLAGDDMIGFACSNTFPSMPAPGGKKACVGNNPFSLAFRADGYPEVCIDMACSVAAYGKMKNMSQTGQTIPLGWMYNKEGQFTQDLKEYGMMVPFAGHKGYGIAFAVEMMTALLAGGSKAYETNRQSIPHLPELASHCFGAINISFFQDPEQFRAGARDYIDYIKTLPVQDGMGPAKYPGEIEYACKLASLQQGITLSSALASEITEVAEALGMPEALYAPLAAR